MIQMFQIYACLPLDNKIIFSQLGALIYSTVVAAVGLDSRFLRRVDISKQLEAVPS